MIEKVYINDVEVEKPESIYINSIEVIPPEFTCQKCGHDKLSFTYVDSNKSIQMRCGKCHAWFGNYKYDKRSKDEIRRDKINEWVKGGKK